MPRCNDIVCGDFETCALGNRAIFARENGEVQQASDITCGLPAAHTDQGMQPAAWFILEDRRPYARSHLILFSLIQLVSNVL